MGTGGFGCIPEKPKTSVTRNASGMRPFSIMDLAPPNQQQRPPLYQPPTPPPDDDDHEAMDWTPSQESKVLRPAASYRTFDALSHPPQSFPHRRNLPTDAVSQGHSHHSPLHQPMFRQGLETQIHGSFKTPKKYTMRDSYDETPFATPYEPAVGSPELSPIKFAQPKFFPHTDHEDLGLESLMANNFSLAEEPREVRARQQYEKRKNRTQSHGSNIYTQWHGSVALLLLAISCMVWTNAPIPSLAAFRLHFGLAALCIAALVILKSLLPAVRKNSDRSLSDIMLLTFELITTMILGVALRQRAAMSSSEDSIGPLKTPGIILMVVLIAQEAWMMFSGTWTRRMTNEEISSPPVTQPAPAPNKLDRIMESGISSTRQNPNFGIATGSASQHPPALSQRTTRSRTKLENDSHASGGFSSLSLGGNARNEQALGISSLNLGQPQRTKRNGR